METAHLQTRLHGRRTRKILGVRIEDDEVLARDKAGKIGEVVHRVKAQPKPTRRRQLVQF